MMVAAAFVGVSAPAACGTLPPEYQRDNEIFFRLDSVEGCSEFDPQPQCFQSCRKLILRGMATRVVGRGERVKGDIDNDNRLINAAQYVANGVVSSTAKLSFEVWNGSGYGTGAIPKWHASTVRVNGVVIDDAFAVRYGRGTPNVRKISLNVPIGLIRWASRIPYSSPIPKENVIEIETVVAEPNNLISNECGDHDGMYFGLRKDRPGQADWRHDEAKLSFEALAPVVMVHGMDSDKSWFTQNGFVEAFDSARVSYLRAPNQPIAEGISKPARTRPDSFGDGPILGAIPERLVYEMEQGAKEFGADRVHIVAHSKGGLWSRAAIERLAADAAKSSKLGVYSLTTLDTPHLGAVLADFSQYAHNHLSPSIYPRVSQIIFLPSHPGSFLTGVGALLLAGRYKWTESVPDLRPAEVRAFNGGNALPDHFVVRNARSKVRYHVVGSDANLDGDLRPFSYLGRISWPDETVGFGFITGPLLYEALQLYGEVHWEKDAGAIGEIENLHPPFDGNDFAVTLRSQFFRDNKTAAAGKFMSTAYASPQVPLRRNHTTVGDAAIGVLVRSSFHITKQTALDN